MSNSKLFFGFFCAITGILALSQIPWGASQHPASFHFKHRFFIDPEEIRKIDVRTLGENLVRRLETCDPGRRKAERGEDDDVQIIMMVQDQALSSMRRFGILNQHTTLLSKGYNARKTRYDVEQDLALLRLPYSSKGRDLLPHYAVMNFHGAAVGHFDFPTFFGNVALVFKPEVKNRTSWSYRDTFYVPDHYRAPYNFPVFSSRYRKSSSDMNMCRGDCDSFIPNCLRFCEGQIWGDLNLADVDYILVPEKTQMTENLTSLGIPVYYWKKDSSVADSIQYSKSGPVRRSEFVSLKPQASMSLEDIRAEKSNLGTPVVTRNILRSKELALLPDDEVLDEFHHASVAQDSMRMSSSAPADGFADRELLAAEIAVRMKRPTIAQALMEMTHDPKDFVRQQAFYGLTEVEFTKFKPFLLQCLQDRAKSVALDCVAYAADHLDDTETAQAIQALAIKSVTDPVVQDWIARIRSGVPCKF